MVTRDMTNPTVSPPPMTDARPSEPLGTRERLDEVHSCSSDEASASCSDWSSSSSHSDVEDIQGAEEEEEEFDLLASQELGQLASDSSAASSRSSSSSGSRRSNHGSRMVLSFPDPIQTSSSEEVVTDLERGPRVDESSSVRVGHSPPPSSPNVQADLDNSILVDGGNYSLLLDVSTGAPSPSLTTRTTFRGRDDGPKSAYDDKANAEIEDRDGGRDHTTSTPPPRSVVPRVHLPTTFLSRPGPSTATTTSTTILRTNATTRKDESDKVGKWRSALCAHRSTTRTPDAMLSSSLASSTRSSPCASMIGFVPGGGDGDSGLTASSSINNSCETVKPTTPAASTPLVPADPSRLDDDGSIEETVNGEKGKEEGVASREEEGKLKPNDTDDCSSHQRQGRRRRCHLGPDSSFLTTNVNKSSRSRLNQVMVALTSVGIVLLAIGTVAKFAPRVVSFRNNKNDPQPSLAVVVVGGVVASLSPPPPPRSSTLSLASPPPQSVVSFDHGGGGDRGRGGGGGGVGPSSVLASPPPPTTTTTTTTTTTRGTIFDAVVNSAASIECSHASSCSPRRVEIGVASATRSTLSRIDPPFSLASTLPLVPLVAVVGSKLDRTEPATTSGDGAVSLDRRGGREHKPDRVSSSTSTAAERARSGSGSGLSSLKELMTRHADRCCRLGRLGQSAIDEQGESSRSFRGTRWLRNAARGRDEFIKRFKLDAKADLTPNCVSTRTRTRQGGEGGGGGGKKARTRSEANGRKGQGSMRGTTTTNESSKRRQRTIVPIKSTLERDQERGRGGGQHEEEEEEEEEEEGAEGIGRDEDHARILRLDEREGPEEEEEFASPATKGDQVTQRDAREGGEEIDDAARRRGAAAVDRALNFVTSAVARTQLELLDVHQRIVGFVFSFAGNDEGGGGGGRGGRGDKEYTETTRKKKIVRLDRYPVVRDYYHGSSILARRGLNDVNALVVAIGARAQRERHRLVRGWSSSTRTDESRIKRKWTRRFDEVVRARAADAWFANVSFLRRHRRRVPSLSGVASGPGQTSMIDMSRLVVRRGSEWWTTSSGVVAGGVKKHVERAAKAVRNLEKRDRWQLMRDLKRQERKKRRNRRKLSEISSVSPGDKYIGLALAISSSIAIGTSFIITKKGLISAADQSDGFSSDSYSYLKNGLWWAGMLTMVVGEVANFAAYTFAPPVLVTPLGALSVLIGAVLAAFFLGERLGPIGVSGCSLCLVGSLIIVLHAPEDKEIATVDEILDYALQPGFMFYCLVVLSYSLYAIYRIAPKHGTSNPLVYISICSLVGSVSVMAVKGFGVALKLTFAGNNQLWRAGTWIFAVTVVGCIAVQMNYFNKALDLFPTTVVNPSYFVGFSSCTLLASIILFHGLNTTGGANTLSLLCGLFVICLGVYLLNLSRSENESSNHHRRLSGVSSHAMRHSLSVPGGAGGTTRLSMHSEGGGGEDGTRRSTHFMRGGGLIGGGMPAEPPLFDYHAGDELHMQTLSDDDDYGDERRALRTSR